MPKKIKIDFADAKNIVLQKMAADMETYLEKFVEDIWDNFSTDEEAGKEWLHQYANIYGFKAQELCDHIYDFLLDTGELRRDTYFSETIQEMIFEQKEHIANYLMEYILMDYDVNKWEEFWEQHMD